MLNHRSPLSPREDEREGIMRARKAAEALFASKRPIREPPIPEPIIPANQSPKPRVLRALSPASVRHAEGVAQVSAERPTPEIPKSQFARIRAWVKYGMTTAQVAAVYGVAVDAIARILNQA